MSERRNRRGECSVEVDSDEQGFVLEPAKIEIGSGYAVSVRYNEKQEQIIDVKTYGKIDVAQLTKEIKRAFPGAHIHRMVPSQSVSIVKRKKRTV